FLVSSRRRHTRSKRDWSSDVCSSDLLEVVAGKSENASHLCHLKRSDLHMSYAVCRMQKVKSAGLKGMQFHNQRERKSRTNDDIDHERTRENYDLKNDKNIDYNERV